MTEVLESPEPWGIVQTLSLVLGEGHPVADVVKVLVPPLELVLVRRQVAAHEAELSGVDPQGDAHPALVAQHPQNTGGHSVDTHIGHVILQLRPDIHQQQHSNLEHIINDALYH